MLMRGTLYQISLIFLGVLLSILFGVFFLRELFPEYKKYQNLYVEMERFRSSYTGEPPPLFEEGIKQIVLENPAGGPPTIDRCTSCHVALEFSHFSPTQIAKDVNGNTLYDTEGNPKLEPNENYIWKKLDEKIADLIDQGKTSEAKEYQRLKTVHVGEHIYEAAKVLVAHPLIGRETRPFETHPIQTYGCTSCHSGNGQGLVTDRAHGPVFDGQYEEQFMGPEPVFLERDFDNDPQFAYVFNHKPGHRLLFQTNPLYVGDLIQAKCMICHETSRGTFDDAGRQTRVVAGRRAEQSKAMRKSFENEKKALESLLKLKVWMQENGYKQVVQHLREMSADYSLPKQEMKEVNAQLDYVLRASGGPDVDEKRNVLKAINEAIVGMLGSKDLAQAFYKTLEPTLESSEAKINDFIEKNRGNEKATGSLFEKAKAVQKDRKAMFFVDEAETTIVKTTNNEKVLSAIQSNIDTLTKDFSQGKSLYFSQACYACHRITGLARGGVGPELTYAGESYPWFLKESIVWPQADLKTSTMPNFRLDHKELEDLVTFLLGQHGRGKAISETDYRQAVSEWEAGAKRPWEMPVNPGLLHDLRFSMTVFASEGCAACHRLKGFDSNVGFRLEKENPDFPALFEERQWFQNLIPEGSLGSEIVRAVDNNKKEIDQRIVDGIRNNGLLEEINEKFPGLVESFYSNFAYASRAKNAAYRELANQTKDPIKKEQILKELDEWKARIHRLLMVYVQEYGLGRLIGPRPNWSGIYRSDEWLIEHFRKPTSHIAHSIMPVMPFDDSKFYALTYMLDVLGVRNRDSIRKIWDTFGFDPQLAYNILCSQCHGEYLHGNGPVSEWIYPIPKNLRNADFLSNYTRQNIINSIVHGVSGTPMPPWGEVAKDKPTADGKPVLTESEINQLVDWLFASLLGVPALPDEEKIQKWQYGPEDVLEELQKEGDRLQPGEPPHFLELREPKPDMEEAKLSENPLLAALDPVIQQQPADHQGGQQIFDRRANLIGPEKYDYYIKDRFYTEANIRAGQHLFVLNCSPCHGIEADGQGFRAGTMYDAKPRMLTNLHWIDTRDDLRLLRSIKYGVTGTSMTPWGDQTSALQRLQLVIFIRTLSLEQQERDALFNQLYRTFDVAEQILNKARIEEYTIINTLKEKLSETNERRLQLLAKAEEGQVPAAQAIPLYQQELQLEHQLKQHEDADQFLLELKDLVAQEKQIYQTLGVTLIRTTIKGTAFEQFLKVLKLNSNNYAIVKKRLCATFDEKKEEQAQQIIEQFITETNALIQQKEKEKTLLLAKLPSQERSEQIEKIESEIKSFENVRNTFASGKKEAAMLREKQKEAYKKYAKKLEEIKQHDAV